MKASKKQSKSQARGRSLHPVVRHFLTVEYICTCGWSVRVKTAATEKHALFYRQGIGPETCFRCRQIASLANCSCCKPNTAISEIGKR